MYVPALTHCCCIFDCICVFLQSCRLGQHRPISKGYPDGIVLVGGSGAKNLADQPVSDWFLKAASGNSDAFTKLKLYAQVCRHNLGMCGLQPAGCVFDSSWSLIVVLLSAQLSHAKFSPSKPLGLNIKKSN